MRRLAVALVALVVLLVAAIAVAEAPGVMRCAPMSGPPGTHVVITAAGIGPGTAVYLDDAYPLPVLYRSRRRLVVVIPSDATTATLLVTNGDEEDACGEFVVTP